MIVKLLSIVSESQYDSLLSKRILLRIKIFNNCHFRHFLKCFILVKCSALLCKSMIKTVLFLKK